MGQQQRPMADEKQLVTLGRVLQILREEENVDVLIETTVNYIQTELGYDLIWIGFYDRVEHRILGKGGVSPKGDTNFLKQRFLLNPGDLLEQVVIQQRPIGVPDLQEATRTGEWGKTAQNLNIRGTLIFPIRYRDRCLGVVLMGSKQWGITPRSEEKARLSMLLGTLAATLNQIEVDSQRRQTKRSDEALLALLNQIRSQSLNSQRLEAIVAQTHQVIGSTRTNIYWFEPEQRYFWRRLGNRTGMTGFGENKAADSGITVQEAGGFYKAMASDQIVSVGEAQSSLKTDITGRLLQRLGVQSLLAAPILLKDELLGFLAVEGNEPRIWKEEEKSYIRGAAQLIALIAPMEEMEKTFEQRSKDAALQAGIIQAISSQEDWQATLKTCAEAMLNRLGAVRFLLLLFDSDTGAFEICYQSYLGNRKPIGSSKGKGESPKREETGSSLAALSKVDWQLLERSQQGVEIEDLSNDLRLLAWRDVLLEAGVRSLLVCSTNPGKPLKGVLVMGSETPHSWTIAERELLGGVSQQLGVILHQWQLQRQMLQEQKIYQTLQGGLKTLTATNREQEGFDPYAYDSVLQPIAQLLDCPLVVWVTWSPGSASGQIIPGLITKQQFAVNADVAVPLATDALIQAALSVNGPSYHNIDQIPDATKQWLCGSGIGEILAIALRTAPEHEPMGVLVVADKRGRIWPNSAIPAFELLVTQLAWSRRSALLTKKLQSKKQELERLNWYKSRRFEDFYRFVETGVKGIAQAIEMRNSGSGVSKDTDLLAARTKQICQQIGSSLTSVSGMIQREQWKMRSMNDLGDKPYETFSLTSLMRRSLERVEPVIKQRRLWSQVHDASGDSAKEITPGKENRAIPNQLNTLGDLFKIELVLYEVLLAACGRTPEGGRIDIWYRLLPVKAEESAPPSTPPPSHLLELSITDNGIIDPQLIAELQWGTSDELAPSLLKQPPGLHLRICQSLLRQMGGDLNLYQMEDGRVLSQLLLPVIANK